MPALELARILACSFTGSPSNSPLHLFPFLLFSFPHLSSFSLSPSHPLHFPFYVSPHFSPVLCVFYLSFIPSLSPLSFHFPLLLLFSFWFSFPILIFFYSFVQPHFLPLLFLHFFFFFFFFFFISADDSCDGGFHHWYGSRHQIQHIHEFVLIDNCHYRFVDIMWID